MPRPCPFVSCRYHLYLDVSTKGKIKVNPLVCGIEEIDQALTILPDTCAIDVANRNPDGITLEQIGNRLGVTRERIRQIEVVALWDLTYAWARAKREECIR